MRGAALLVVFTLVVNIPFGFWRARTRRMSAPWFVAVHGPVPLIAGLRLLAGVGWSWPLLPATVLAYLCGQLLGGRLAGGRR